MKERRLEYIEQETDHAGACLGGYTKHEDQVLESFSRDAITVYIPELIKSVRRLKARVKKMKEQSK